jgi:glycine/D-amino acid oxidase-like deaminating enzyme
MFLSDSGDGKQMEENYHLQTSHGVEAELLDRDEIKRRLPSMNVEDVELGVYSPNDAWIDPHAALQGFRRKARSLGVEYLQDRVVEWTGDGTAARRVTLESGGTAEAEVFVLAAGAWSGEIAEMIGMDLPIRPMSRQTHYFLCASEIEPLPFIKTESDLAFRPEGVGYTGGVPDWEMGIGFDWNIAPKWFEESVWPVLAHRFPAFEELKLDRTWACHYGRCLLDKNAIIGPWVGGLRNVYVCSGFSGHGIMQAPAAGLAVAELLVDGGYRIMDLTRLGYQRVIAGEPYPELGII